MLEFNTLGQIAWLWSNSDLHREWSVSTMSNFILPPIVYNQYILVQHEDGFPAAYCSWAFLNDAAELNYIANSSHIEPNDWNTGSNIWIVDFISPFGSAYTKKVFNSLKENFSDTIISAIRVKKPSKTGRIKAYLSNNILPNDRRRRKSDRFLDLTSRLKQDTGFKTEFSEISI